MTDQTATERAQALLSERFKDAGGFWTPARSKSDRGVLAMWAIEALTANPSLLVDLALEAGGPGEMIEALLRAGLLMRHPCPYCGGTKVRHDPIERRQRPCGFCGGSGEQEDVFLRCTPTKENSDAG